MYSYPSFQLNGNEIKPQVDVLGPRAGYGDELLNTVTETPARPLAIGGQRSRKRKLLRKKRRSLKKLKKRNTRKLRKLLKKRKTLNKLISIKKNKKKRYVGGSLMLKDSASFGIETKIDADSSALANPLPVIRTNSCIA